VATTTKSGTKADLQQLNVRVPKEPLRRVADLRVRDRQHHQRCRLRAIVDFLATAGGQEEVDAFLPFLFCGRAQSEKHHDISRHLARP